MFNLQVARAGRIGSRALMGQSASPFIGNVIMMMTVLTEVTKRTVVSLIKQRCLSSSFSLSLPLTHSMLLSLKDSRR